MKEERLRPEPIGAKLRLPRIVFRLVGPDPLKDGIVGAVIEPFRPPEEWPMPHLRDGLESTAHALQKPLVL